MGMLGLADASSLIGLIWPSQRIILRLSGRYARPKGVPFQRLGSRVKRDGWGAGIGLGCSFWSSGRGKTMIKIGLLISIIMHDHQFDVALHSAFLSPLVPDLVACI